MGDSRRFDLFGRIVQKYIDKKARIADVAGGKGYLSLNLKERGFSDITTFDKRFYKVRNINFLYSFFKHTTNLLYDAVIGMHPDEGSEEIIAYAKIHKVPFILCPCCTKPSITAWYGKPLRFTFWLEHLINFASEFEIRQETLPMNGKSLCLIGIPK